MHGIGATKDKRWQERGKKPDRGLKEIMAEKFPNLMKTINSTDLKSSEKTSSIRNVKKGRLGGSVS